MTRLVSTRLNCSRLDLTQLVLLVSTRLDSSRPARSHFGSTRLDSTRLNSSSSPSHLFSTILDSTRLSRLRSSRPARSCPISSRLVSTRLDWFPFSPHLISFSSCLGSTRLVSLGHTAVCPFALRWLCHSPRSIVSFMDRDCNTVLDIQFYRILFTRWVCAWCTFVCVMGCRCVLTLGASSFAFVASQRFSFTLALSVDSFVFDSLWVSY